MTDLDDDLLIRVKAAYRERDQLIQRLFGTRAAGLVGEARQNGDPEALCLSLRASGWAERYALEHRHALQLLNEAARIARRNRLSHVLGEVLVTRGAIHHELGRLSAARRDFDAAEPLIPPDERRRADQSARDAVRQPGRSRLGREPLRPAAEGRDTPGRRPLQDGKQLRNPSGTPWTLPGGTCPVRRREPRCRTGEPAVRRSRR